MYCLDVQRLNYAVGGFGKFELIEHTGCNPSYGLPIPTVSFAMKIFDDPDIKQNCFVWISMFDRDQRLSRQRLNTQLLVQPTAQSISNSFTSLHLTTGNFPETAHMFVQWPLSNWQINLFIEDSCCDNRQDFVSDSWA